MSKSRVIFVILNLFLVNFSFCTEQVDIKTEGLPYSYPVDQRKPFGIGIAPYPLTTLPRYILNYMTNGYFSSNTLHNACLLPQSGAYAIQSCNNLSNQSATVKIVFLGDVMMSQSGSFPTINSEIVKLLTKADVVVANVEAPIVKQPI